MATKTITLELDAYERLRRAKRAPRESFSAVVRRAVWPEEPLTAADYRHEMLTWPERSVQFGTWFLNLLLGEYDGDWIAALVGYNAGPGNVANWTGGQPIVDHDLFFETLPSQQAQDYVRYIYEQYSRYRQIYRAAAIEGEE